MFNESTPTLNTLPLRLGDFGSLAEALDYAAQGDTGANFYTGKGDIYASMNYGQLRDNALSFARKLIGLGLNKGDRVALVAETHPDFLNLFFGCQYAGLVPVTLPIIVNVSSHAAYTEHLRGLLASSQAKVAVSPEGFLSFLEEAAQGMNLSFIGEASQLAELPASSAELPTVLADDVAYIQYTSGSTRFPRGVMITQHSVMSNLQGIMKEGVKLREGDRFFSWLPFYHDMGMIGLILVPVASQLSVDYLDTREFAKRPRLWLRLLSSTKASISISPSFGYELCMRRLRPGEASDYDLSNWRVAGTGAEMIQPDTLVRFGRALAPAGFNDKAFLACYGMAETALAISFAEIDQGHQTDWVDIEQLSQHGKAVPIDSSTPQNRVKGFVLCGKPLQEYETEIRDEDGEALPERHCGVIHVRGQSVMSGYFNSPEETAATLSKDGWLNTGDIGYMVGDQLVITGRKKDLIIINGRNIWPQDLEHVAEKQPEIRMGDALAFSAPAPGGEICVLVVECRETNPNKRAALRKRLATLIRQEIAVDCFVELVPIRTLPSTSSGKPSRSKARQQFLERTDLRDLQVMTE